MFFTLSRLSRRPDIRPIYRRIFTNRRLDILSALSGIFLIDVVCAAGFSFIITSVALYYTYEKPIKRQERRRLELEILEAELAGFSVIEAEEAKCSRLAQMFGNLREGGTLFLSSISTLAIEQNKFLFTFGVILGAGFELFKNHFSPKGISFYKVFRENNLSRELQTFENTLKEREQKIAASVRKIKAINNSQWL